MKSRISLLRRFSWTGLRAYYAAHGAHHLRDLTMDIRQCRKTRGHTRQIVLSKIRGFRRTAFRRGRIKGSVRRDWLY
jgi:hypothetical protein